MKRQPDEGVTFMPTAIKKVWRSADYETERSIKV